MRRGSYILLLAALVFSNASFATGRLIAYLSCASFNASSGRSYIETYINVVGQTATFVKDSAGGYEAKVNVRVTFLKGDSIIAADNYSLHSPQIKDTSKKPDFIGEQRYWLPKGDYSVQVTLKDMNDKNAKSLTGKQDVPVGFSADSLKISDVEFLQSYVASNAKGAMYKNGYEMVPYIYNYYPEDVNQLKFYTEVYNANKIIGQHEKFILQYFIESEPDKVKLPDFNSVSVQQADTVISLLGGFNITNLPSGSYSLTVQVADKNNTIKATRSFNFIRHNPHTEMSMKNLAAVNTTNTFVTKMIDKDSLVENIRCLWPISGIGERDFEDSKSLPETDITLLRQYFYNFWKSRSDTNPERAWKDYHLQVIAVNKSFGAMGIKGYHTDRGRVYLQYGAPNHRVQSDMNPTSYPYEIWEYYKLPDGEVDKKFVFYEPNLVDNYYVLLHSTANHEVHQRQWQILLSSRTGQTGGIDQDTYTEPFGENALDEFNDPR